MIILALHALQPTNVLPATVLFRESPMLQQVNVNVMICFGMMVRTRPAKLASLPVSPVSILPIVYPVTLLVTDCSILLLISSIYLVLSVSASIVTIPLHSIMTAFLATIPVRSVSQERGMTVCCAQLRQNDF